MLLKRVLEESTRKPDIFILMCESEEDAVPAYPWQNKYPNLYIKVHPTPLENGKYKIIPYSNKINWALDEVGVSGGSSRTYINYLDNYSLPHPRKYELMVNALDANSEVGAVYCSQDRTGYRVEKWISDRVIKDAYCVLNYTQVMHRYTDDRWDLDMVWADPDVADARFFRRLHNSIGSFYPVLLGSEMLDQHYAPFAKAEGI
jgi:hypothetical protein